MKSFLNYAVMPQIKPRIEALFTSGFQYIAFFIALVYGAVRLLPANHPYLSAGNIGKFGIRHVVAEAANNLELKRQNIDQILLFICVLVGIILILIQILLLGMSFIVQPVMASMPTNFAGFFITPNPDNDIAHIMMDMVFGVPDLFNSCIAQGIACKDSIDVDVTSNVGVGTITDGASVIANLGFPFPIHTAMHQMFQLYSTGLLVVATFIAIYFMIAVVAETAQTGTAFGKRFNKVWAPIRIVVAFGLLIPVGFGLNGSQYLVLYAAKFGSGFATNGWILFNTSLSSDSATAAKGLMGDGQELTTIPNIPEVDALLQFFYTARTCAELEHRNPSNLDSSNNLIREIDMYLVKGSDPTGAANNALKVNSRTSVSYLSLLNFVNGSNKVFMRFGTQDASAYNLAPGNVSAQCGEIALELNDPRKTTGTNPADEGTKMLQMYYWTMLKHMWFDAYTGILTGGQNYPENLVSRETQWDADSTAAEPDQSIKTELQEYYAKNLKAIMLDPTTADAEFSWITSSTGDGAIDTMSKSGRFAIDPVLESKGWAGAAIWYNRVAELNGAVTSAVLNIPSVVKFPDVMEYVQRKKKQQDQSSGISNRFDPILASGEPVPPQRPEDAAMMPVLAKAFNFWQADGGGSSSHNAPTGNAMIDAINALFGTEGLYNIKNNPDSHALAQLVGVGRSLVEASVRNLAAGVVGGAAGAGFAFIDQFVGSTVSTAATFLVTFAMVGLTAGFILFYIVPFLPFIYFFFAVGGWIKGIFEAMVGAPLWALAHIRIDGEGLAGQAAVNGYFLIFEIFLRPILILFGILASISIFSALVGILHQIFDLLVDNVGGFDNANAGNVEFMRSSVDQFFYTVVYTIIVYLMGMASFKLIDLIPNNILRWMGQSVATFNDQREDAAQALVGKATIGAQQTSGALGQGLKGIAGAGG